MLGAIIFAVLGIIVESRLPRIFMGAYDTRITEGYIGVTVTADESRMADAEKVLRDSGGGRTSNAAGSKRLTVR